MTPTQSSVVFRSFETSIPKSLPDIFDSFEGLPLNLFALKISDSIFQIPFICTLRSRFQAQFFLVCIKIGHFVAGQRGKQLKRKSV